MGKTIDCFKFTRPQQRRLVRGDMDIVEMTEIVVREAERAAEELAYNTNRLLFNAVALYLHDKCGFGKKRLQEAIDKFDNQLDAYTKGYLSLSDMEQTLLDECDFKITVRKEFSDD